MEKLFKNFEVKKNRFCDYLFETPFRQDDHVDIANDEQSSIVTANEKTEMLVSLKALVQDAHEKKIEFNHGTIQIIDNDQGREWLLDGELVAHGQHSHLEQNVIFVADKLPLTSSSEDLLAKMAKAMGLSQGEWSLVGITTSKELEDAENEEESIYQKGLRPLLSTIALAKSEVVLCLGATASRLLLSKKEKLSKIHGRQFKSKIVWNNGANAHNFHLVPIFHPDFLLINPNMKRTAWDDLQGVMASFLNKG